MTLLNHFPHELKEPRQQQREALTFLESAFADDVNVVVLELPVGSGKSGIGMTVSRAFGGGIVAMPVVALQAQYCNEFDKTAPLMGRGRFPCLKNCSNAQESVLVIRRGEMPVRPILEESCATAPCLNKPKSKQDRIKAECEAQGGCPYQHHIDHAQQEETIVSNLHSLIYSVSLSDKISKRKVLVIDEAHDVEAFFRSFMTTKFKVRRKVDHKELSNLKTTDDWIRWLGLPNQTVLLTNEEQRDSYAARLEKLAKAGDTVAKYWDDEKDDCLWLELIPTNVAGICRSMLLPLAEKIVFMSGTLYDKNMFLRPLGIDPTTSAMLRLSSDFPKENRKVVLPRVKDLDLSHKGWYANLPAAVKEINSILNDHPDHKGVIHTNSYRMTKELVESLGNDRIVSHSSHDFQDKLRAFFASTEPQVFMSPVCGQGVDFKGDRARFQIAVRPAYGAITEPFNAWLIEKGYWQVYNYQAAKNFGQMLGRVVRSNDDWGVTYLLSWNFYNMIQKVGHLLPLWVKQGMVKEL